MNDLKTKPNELSVDEYIKNVTDNARQQDARDLLKIMTSATNEKPVMWGSSIVGFGSKRYKYASGREGDWMIVGFSARKRALTLYGLAYYDQVPADTKALGTFTLGKGCVYIKRLEDVTTNVLEKMIANAYEKALPREDL